MKLKKINSSSTYQMCCNFIVFKEKSSWFNKTFLKSSFLLDVRQNIRSIQFQYNPILPSFLDGFWTKTTTVGCRWTPYSVNNFTREISNIFFQSQQIKANVRAELVIEAGCYKTSCLLLSVTFLEEAKNIWKYLDNPLAAAATLIETDANSSHIILKAPMLPSVVRVMPNNG